MISKATSNKAMKEDTTVVPKADPGDLGDAAGCPSEPSDGAKESVSFGGPGRLNEKLGVQNASNQNQFLQIYGGGLAGRPRKKKHAGGRPRKSAQSQPAPVENEPEPSKSKKSRSRKNEEVEEMEEPGPSSSVFTNPNNVETLTLRRPQTRSMSRQTQPVQQNQNVSRKRKRSPIKNESQPAPSEKPKRGRPRKSEPVENESESAPSETPKRGRPSKQKHAGGRKKKDDSPEPSDPDDNAGNSENEKSDSESESDEMGSDADFGVPDETVLELIERLFEQVPVVDSTNALGQRHEELKHGAIEPKIALNYVPGLDPIHQIQCDCLTLALMDYIRKDTRPIGLMSPGIWDRATRQHARTENPLDYLVVKPKNPCKYLIVPIWRGAHYISAILTQSPTSNTLINCFFIDSNCGSPAVYVDALKRIADQVFKPISGMQGAFSFAIRDISNQSYYQNFSVDAINCGAFVVHNTIEFLEVQKIPNSEVYLRPTELDGFEMRFKLTEILLELFELTDDQKSDILVHVIRNMPDNNFYRELDPEVEVVLPSNEADLEEEIEEVDFTQQQERFRTQPLQNVIVGPQFAPEWAYEEFATQPTPYTPAPKKQKQLGKVKGKELRSGRIIDFEFKERNIARKPGRAPGRPALNNAAVISNGIVPKSFDVGQLYLKCQYCRAMLFAGENETRCCNNGRVKMEPFKDYPPLLNKLLCGGYQFLELTEEEKTRTKWFRPRMRPFNSLLSLGSVTYDTRESGVKNMAPVHLVSGDFHYNLCTIKPLNPNGPRRFGQLYTMPTPMKDTLIAELKKNKFYTKVMGTNGHEKLVFDLYKLVRKLNPLAQGFKTAFERIKELEKVGHEDYVVRFVERKDLPDKFKHLDDKNDHDHQVNLPVVSEAAMLFQPAKPGESVPAGPKGIWMFPTNDVPKVYLRHLPVLFSLTNTLVFLRGELLYSLNLPMIVPKSTGVNENELLNRVFDENAYAQLNTQARNFAEELYAQNVQDVAEGDFIDFEANLRFDDENNFEKLEQGHLPENSRVKKCSIRMQIRYRMQRRESDNGIHHIWNWRTVGFFIVISGHFEIVRREIDFYANRVEHRKISCKYVREHAEKLLQKNMPGYTLGYLARIPKYHKLSDNYRNRFYADSLALTRKHGSPTFFITVTGNPKWQDYVNACHETGTDPDNSPDLMMRVFELKLRKLMHHLTGPNSGGNGIFGPCIAYLVSIEYQKRGNPHAHILLWIGNSEDSADYVDQFISARVPDPKINKDLFELVKKYNLHLCNKDSVCRKKDTGKCKSFYPQREYLETKVGDGFVNYKRIYRENGGFATEKNQIICDDRYVVPYNPYLLKAWDGHCNVEYVVSRGTPGYAIKYVLKSQTKIFVEIMKQGIEGNPFVKVDEQNKIVDIDEASYFLKLNYISVFEAIGMINSLGPFIMSHTVTWLGVHLPGDTIITCADGTEIEEIVRRAEMIEKHGAYSRLTAWFKFCWEHRDDEEIMNMTYVAFNERHNFDRRNFTYEKSGRNTKRIVCMYEANVRNAQLIALRTILLFVPGLKCFEDAATVGVGDEAVCYVTFEGKLDFAAAAKARGYLESDLLWRNALDQRKYGTARRMIFALAQVFLEAGPNLVSARDLWNEYKQFMILPLGNANPETIEALRRSRENFALSILKFHLEERGAKLSDFELTEPDDLNIPPYDPDVHGEEANGYMNGEFGQMNLAAEIPHVDLNDEQQFVFDQIWDAIENAGDESEKVKDPAEFFIVGPGGVGKTTVYGQLIKRCHEENYPVIATASTGVAATLLPNGTTLHSRFFVPTSEDRLKDLPRMPAECSSAAALRRCALLVIDEATQISKDVYSYVKKTLKSVRNPNHEEVKRRLVIVFGGDFRQLLPVVADGTVEDAFSASLIKMYDPEVDNSVRFLSLKRNQRAAGDEQAHFREFLLKIGRGATILRNQPDFSTFELPDYIETVDDLPPLIEKVFPAASLTDPSVWQNSAIIAPLNVSVDLINAKIQDKLPGDYVVYEAINTPNAETVDPFNFDGMNAMQEAMAKIDENGLPKQTLKLKVGSKVVFTRNVAKNMGLCNGTPAIVEELSPDVITVRKIGKDGRPGMVVDVLRCRVVREIEPRKHRFFSFTRTQFPLAPAFAMTIHKAQGQTLQKVGLFLSSSAFGSGQMYVAFTRPRSYKDIVVFNPTGTRTIVNIVHPGVREFVDKIDSDPVANAPQ